MGGEGAWKEGEGMGRKDREGIEEAQKRMMCGIFQVFCMELDYTLSFSGLKKK